MENFPTNGDLVKRIEAACKRGGVTETTFGRRAVNDGSLIADLRAGRDIFSKTLRKINATIDEIEAEASEARADVAMAD